MNRYSPFEYVDQSSKEFKWRRAKKIGWLSLSSTSQHDLFLINPNFKGLWVNYSANNLINLRDFLNTNKLQFETWKRIAFGRDATYLSNMFENQMEYLDCINDILSYFPNVDNLRLLKTKLVPKLIENLYIKEQEENNIGRIRSIEFGREAKEPEATFSISKKNIQIIVCTNCHFW